MCSCVCLPELQSGAECAGVTIVPWVVGRCLPGEPTLWRSWWAHAWSLLGSEPRLPQMLKETKCLIDIMITLTKELQGENACTVCTPWHYDRLIKFFNQHASGTCPITLWSTLMLKSWQVNQDAASQICRKRFILIPRSETMGVDGTDQGPGGILIAEKTRGPVCSLIYLLTTI